MHSGEAAPGRLFAALSEGAGDGHDYAVEAAQAGAVVLIERDLGSLPDGATSIRVDSVLKALHRLAAWQRGKLKESAVVIGITGSAGKTTTRRCCEALFRSVAPNGTAASTRSYNNHIGVPLSLLRADSDTRYLVLEIGANSPGEIADLAGLARPHIGVLLNALPVHLEGFGSVDGVVRGKGELIDAVSGDGAVVLNADDSACDRWRRRAGQRRIVTFSAKLDSIYSADTSPQSRADVQGGMATGGTGGMNLDIHFRGHPEPLTVRPGLHGEHNRANVLAAAAAGWAAGLAPEQIIRGLEGVGAERHRGELFRCKKDGTLVIDDSYNANPEALKAALHLLAEQAASDNILVFGSMGELGERAAELHREVGEYAARLNFYAVLALGEYAPDFLRGFGDPKRGLLMPDLSSAAIWLDRNTPPGAAVLIKGSRAIGLDWVAQDFLRSRGGGERC